MPQSVKTTPGGGDDGGGGGEAAMKRPAPDDGAEAKNKAARAGGVSMTLVAKRPLAVSLTSRPSATQQPARGISMKLSGGKVPATGVVPPPTLKPKSSLAAAAFGDDSDDDEEMPAEARMRMKNIGRETPTSAGPNSFGKTKIGFCDSKKSRDKDGEDDKGDKDKE